MDMAKPKIRFKGYTDEWEQRKFADFTWDAGKRNKEDLELEPYAITNEHGFIRQRDAHDDFGYMKDTDRKAYNIVQPNSFAYNPARINVGSIGYYKGVENVIVSSLYEVFQTDNYVNDRFLWHWLKSDEFPRWIEKLQEGSVRLYFYYDKLCECQLYMPSLEEQEKIASFLDGLDHLITLHQRKCEQAKKLKKYMLQKMFPQNGQKVPEIRFKGFTDDWEQRKLGELAEIVGGGTPSTSVESYWDGDIDWYAPAEIGEQIYLKSSQRKITEEGLNKSSAKVLPVGTVLFTSRAGIGKTAILLKEGCTNQGFQSIVPNKNKLDSYFIFTRSEELKRYGETVGAGSTFVEVSGKQMANMELMMPTTMDEQQKIGEYFSNLDNLITLHQQKCDELKNIKKFMLQNMFM